jgi:hypothetical protein
MGDDANAVTTGRCMCGDIRFEYRGAPIETGHCHCESCRRHTSAPFATYVVIDKAAFRYTRGEPVVYQSSPGVERTHCARCGSPISYENRTSRPPRRMGSYDFGLFVGVLDDPAPLKPDRHIRVAEKMPWIEIGDSLAQYEFGAVGATPVRYGPGRVG